MSDKQNFISHVKRYGFDKPNRFKVEIPIPKILEDLSKDDNKKKLNKFVKFVKIIMGTNITRGLSVMCEQTEMAGLTLNTTENFKDKLAYSTMYGNQQFIFNLSADMKEKIFIDAWMDSIVDNVSGDVSYYDDYTINLVVHKQNSQNRTIQSIILYDCYPVTLTPITISHTEQNTITKMSVQFAYRYWDSIEGGINGKYSDFNQTVLGPIIGETLNNPLVQKGLTVIKEYTGADLTAEGLNVFNQLDSIVENVVGLGIGKSTTILNTLKADSNSNNKLSNGDKTVIADAIDKILGG